MKKNDFFYKKRIRDSKKIDFGTGIALFLIKHANVGLQKKETYTNILFKL